MIYMEFMVDKRIPRRRQGGQGILLLGLVKWEWMAVFLLSGDGGHVPQEEETDIERPLAQTVKRPYKRCDPVYIKCRQTSVLKCTGNMIV